METVEGGVGHIFRVERSGRKRGVDEYGGGAEEVISEVGGCRARRGGDGGTGGGGGGEQWRGGAVVRSRWGVSSGGG